MDATAQLEKLAAKQVSARELLDDALARDSAVNPRINAVVARDIDHAKRAALAIDEDRARGRLLGCLAGLPMTVKDTFDVVGMPASAGLPEYLKREAADAEVVRRVRAQGAVIWGKTNTPVKAADVQTYNKLYGVTNNPWDLTRTSGGSSGGSAAALSAGISSLEIGADIGGSLRLPASYCGVYAHKPTYGLVSQRGLVPKGEADVDMGVVGPMARSARDLALLLSIMADWRPTEPAIQPLKGLKVAIWNEPSFTLDAPVASALAKFEADLDRSGARVTPVVSPLDARQLMFAYTMLLFSLMSADFPAAARGFFELLRGPALLARGLGAGPLSWAQGVIAYTTRHRDWLAADEVRAQISRQMDALFAEYDVLIAPVSPVVAFSHDHRPINARRLEATDGSEFSYLKLFEWISLATLCGLPATAIPIAKTGLPIGIQIIGRRGDDAKTLAVAAAIEREIGGFRAPPP